MNRLSWIIIISTILISALIIVFIGRPIVISFYKTYIDTKNANQELSNIAKKKDILEQFSENSNFNTIYTNASNYIPITQNTGDLVIEITALAAQNNLKVSSFSFDSGTSKSSSSTSDSSKDSSKDTTKDTSTDSSSSSPSSPSTSSSSPPSEIKFTTTLNGSFKDFLNFLKGVETGNRLISITSMALSQATDSFTVNIIGKAYWKKDTTLPKTLANINISKSVLDKFTNLKTYGTPIDLPTESGFGRENPFSGF